MKDDPLGQMVRIPAGEFLMGCDDVDKDERPVHPVYVDEFHLGAKLVTNGEYRRFVHATGCRPIAVRELPALVAPGFRDSFRELAERYVWKNAEPPEGLENHPVTLVQYVDALDYCQWLAAITGKAIRLPSEAEWERAARGGLEGRRYPWGDDIDPSFANFLTDPMLKAKRGTRSVGSYPCNGYGLYDMAGNVWQWCSDWYRPDTYVRLKLAGEAVVRNPQGPSAGYSPGNDQPQRVHRGGSFLCTDQYCTRYMMGTRGKGDVDTASNHLGFRCIKDGGPGAGKEPK